MAFDPAAEMMAFTASIDFDRRLGIAHVHGLCAAGILSTAEQDALETALEAVKTELEEDRFVFVEDDEDVHSAIERRVTELCGTVGEKLHTGRSRNDQVATALRLYVRRALGGVAAKIFELEDVLVVRAHAAGGIYLPGYTHLQRAQSVLLSHHLLAHAWALERDLDRLVDALKRADVSPLGAGALGGSSLGLLPDGVAAELGFERRFENSLDAVSDRDFVAETLFVLALLGVHLSRLGEEIVLFSSAEFGFYVLDDAWATGSSMLPQKKNPDVAELVRAKSGRLIGHLTGFLATLKGLPLSYNRDLQEDKEPLFDALDQMGLALSAVSGLMQSLSFDAHRMQQAADAPGLVAIDLAEWLVAKGMPFRQAHGVVAELVRRSLEGNASLNDLVGSDSNFGPDAVSLFEPGASINRRQSPGGAGAASVKAQFIALNERLEAHRQGVARVTTTEP